MMHRPPPAISAIFLLGVLATLPVPTAMAIDQQWPATDTCEWPSSVQVWMKPMEGHPAGFTPGAQAKCSGVYVGTHIVLTAGHCIDHMEDIQVRFGEDGDDPFYIDDSPICKAHPDGEWVFVDAILEDGYVYEGADIAYCKLSSGHPQPPYVPVMVGNGCEADYLREQLSGVGADPFGEPIKFVASGAETSGDDPPVGTKRVGPGSLLFEAYSDVHHGQAVVLLQPNQGEDIAVRPGDSGGPVLYEMPDGSWRVIGLNSYLARLNYDLDGTGQELRNHVVATSVPRWIPWVESQSNNDITPCQDWTGTHWEWEGGPGCGSSWDTQPQSSNSDWAACSSYVLQTSEECAGWNPPPNFGIDGLLSPTEADSLLDFLSNGNAGGAPGSSLGGRLRLPRLDGTERDDEIRVDGSTSQQVFGGRGNDALLGGYLDDELHGGFGDDHLTGGPGNDILVGGRGRDEARGGDGDDTIVVAGTCELEPGEIIDGGPGYDKLYSPVDEKALYRLGVRVSGIEKVVMNHPDAERDCHRMVEMGPAFSDAAPGRITSRDVAVTAKAMRAYVEFVLATGASLEERGITRVTGGGQASCEADCPGGETVVCEGPSCEAIDGLGCHSWDENDNDLETKSCVAPAGGFAPQGLTPLARYVIPTARAKTGSSGDHVASTVVALANLQSTPCQTEVDWYLKTGELWCTSTVTVEPGHSRRHCAQSPPPFSAFCDDTCTGEPFASGRAVIKLNEGCTDIVVDAHTFFHVEETDLFAAAVQLKVYDLPLRDH